ncbi:MAG: response regulator transcription factor [Oscillospiraceae bacterium]|nr:response regulator transcription factor [Oscillospiraceae bacterium]
MHILIIEDEPVIARTIADLLATQGDTSDLAYDGIAGLDQALTKQYDAVVLDIMLPGMDGFQIAQTLRRQGNATPILMLTARTQVGDRVNGLDCGADYYLTKPFSSQELLACLRAITRRREAKEETALSFADLRLELSACVLSCGGRSVGLSQREMGLMSLFLRNAGRAISKEELIRQVWGGYTEENSVEVYISFLRKKLQHLGSRTAIRTLRTVGYRLEVQP